MIELKREIEDFLNSNWSNTNDKEQNMQGRLYAWLLRFEQQGYTIEMETSIYDEHLTDVITEDILQRSGKPCKTEMDIYIHKGDMEQYAIELKWIYNKTTGWNVVDHLGEFEKDAQFCNWLADKADFTETCSVVVYDFEESKQVKRFSPKERVDEKFLFLGGDYPADKSKVGYINAGDEGHKAPFTWHKLESNKCKNRDYYYYVISFHNKHKFATEIAAAIEKIYGFRFDKCMALVMQSSWYNGLADSEHVVQVQPLEIIASVCKEIDNNTII